MELLQQLEGESLGNQLVESDAEPGEIWRGFVFNIDELSLAVPFVGEFEIIPCGELSPLPIAKSWIKGMTNIRGEIYTIVDFSEFIGKKPVRTTKGCNLLLLPDTGLKSALLIESVVRLKSFSADLPTVNVESFHSGLAPYLSAVINDGEINWGVINIQGLSDSADFSCIEI